MYELLLSLFALIATVFSVWLYWQVQQSEARITQKDAEIRDQAQIVGELADEISMASTYLYEAMDRFLADVEPKIQAAQELTTEGIVAETGAPESVGVSPLPETDDPTWWTVSEIDETDVEIVSEEPASSFYHPHIQALALAAQGEDLVEIARQTGLGVEELRLLLHFRDELSVAG